MTYPQSQNTSVTILHKINLGQHTLFIKSDKSIDLLVNDRQMHYREDNMLSLDNMETYRLFISLWEQFK